MAPEIAPLEHKWQVTEMAQTVALLSAALLPLAVASACATPGMNRTSPVSFDTATAWIHQRSDSTQLLVEIASSNDQHEVGLAGRLDLDPESGMLFEFDRPRSADDGFWMWRTRVPLDIAFVDEAGVILNIQSMEVCESDDFDDCPGYFPGVGYVAALETNRGWFARNGIDVGARVTVVR